jgi:uncharacterized protein (TIGR01777 family)
MKVFVTGATGFIGRALILRLRHQGHQPVAFVRDPPKARRLLAQEAELLSVNEPGERLVETLSQCDGVINLAGEPLFAKRWNEERKRMFIESRVGFTQNLVKAIEKASPRPKVLVSVSAVGFYGDRKEQPVDESTPAADDFLAQLCVDWEAASQTASPLDLRVVNPRLGLVLGLGGGLLDKMITIFRKSVGGPLGDGRQYMPWIHLEDVISLLSQALEDETMSGAYNFTSLEPVSNLDFTKRLGKALGKPTALRAPKIALKLVLGEAARATLGGQRALPKRLLKQGYKFRFSTLESAFEDLLADNTLLMTRTDSTSTPGLKYVLEHHTRLAEPIENVFDFFSRAENMALMIPANMPYEIFDHETIKIQPPSEIDYPIKLKGISKGLHQHQFLPDGDHSTMVERLFFSPSLGSGMNIKYKLVDIFRYRSQALRSRFGFANGK